MKIKRAPKKHPSTNPGIANFINALDRAQNHELPYLLQLVILSGWTWPRTDLQHWIVPLNRFDSILEGVIVDYDLSSMEHPQTNAFTPRTKELVLAILMFEKVLLENSTNRKIFASFDRLNDLLHTSDLSVLLATLSLALRPAQQYSNGHALTANFGITEKRLLTLGQGWGTKEYGLDMVDLSLDGAEIPAELDELEWQFYKMIQPGQSYGHKGNTVSDPVLGEKKDKENDKGKEKEKESDKGKEKEKENVEAMDVEESHPTPGTPGPKSRTTTFPPASAPATPLPPTSEATLSNHHAIEEGMTFVHLGNVSASPKSAVDILLDAIEAHNIPESDRFDLFQKIRIAKALGDPDQRRTMLCIRLLAIAVFAHTSSESSAQSKVFLYEPELITQLAELVHPDRQVPIEVQTAALYALDAVAKFKAKLSEVASALNASVSHGILMYVVRRTVSDLQGDNPRTSHDFIDALFNILTYFHTTAFVGNMIVGAGIVPLLVDFVRNTRRDRISVVTRATVFLDGLMYGYSSAFNLFIAAGGLDLFVTRIKNEIELCIESNKGPIPPSSSQAYDAPTGMLSFEQAALLKGLLRAIQRLMQTAGTTEGLRNLIDSSLLTSLKLMMNHRYVFGPQMFGLAMNMTAIFVHNEPTSLTVIQEAKVPEAFYDAIEERIPAAIDVLQAVPNVIGALCLNAAGLLQFTKRQAMTEYFKIFTSDAHVKVLQERDNGNMIGGAIDELIRHHPSLKDMIMTNIHDVLQNIKEKGMEFKPENVEGYTLQTVDSGPGADMSVASIIAMDATIAAETPQPEAAESGDDGISLEKPKEAKDNIVLACIDVYGRFLEGLFQNLQHCKDFVKRDPFGDILDLLALPSSPANMPATPAFVSVSGLLRIISEVKPGEVITAIVKRLSTHLETTKGVWDKDTTDIRLMDLCVSLSGRDAVGNTFRELTYVLTYVALLSDIYGNLTYSHGKVATSTLAVLAVEDSTLKDIGQLFRFCSKEDIMLSPLLEVQARLGKGAKVQLAGPNSADSSTAPSDNASSKAHTDHELSVLNGTPNTKIVVDLARSIRSNIPPLFQSISKLFVHRRSTDYAHRKASGAVAISLAAIMKRNLMETQPGLIADEEVIGTFHAFLRHSAHMVSTTMTLLFDERGSISGLQTLLLDMFVKVGGFEALMSLYSYYEKVGSWLLDSVGEVKSATLLVDIFSGLKAVLELLRRLSNHKTVLEAPQTALLLAREKEKDGSDYLDPHELLVTIRSAMIGPVASTWRTTWLNKSPPYVVRSIVDTLLNILKGEGETGADNRVSADSSSTNTTTGGLMNSVARSIFGVVGREVGTPPPQNATPPAFVLDQSRVTQLVDMGFPRSAVEVALTRCRNSVGVATEYLLQHPALIEVARDSEAAAARAPMTEAVAPSATQEDREGQAATIPSDDPTSPTDATLVPETTAAANLPTVDIEMQQDESSTGGEEEKEESATKRKVMISEARSTLAASRLELQDGFLSRALTLAEIYNELVFNIKSAYGLFGSTTASGSPTLSPLLTDLKEASTTPIEKQNAIHIRWQLIALIASDAVYRSTIEADREATMEVLLTYCRDYIATSASTEELRSKWLASAMLVAEALFSFAEVPKTTTILPEDAVVPNVSDVAMGPVWQDERQAWFDVAFEILKAGTSKREVFISTLRLLIIITRDHAFAIAFAEKGGVRFLMASFTKERPETEGCRSYAVMILRHIVEDNTILRSIIAHEIEAWFGQPRAKVADITALIRGSSSIAFRHFPSFLQALQSHCKLVQADPAGNYHISLANDLPRPSTADNKETSIRSPFAGEEVSEPAHDWLVEDGAKAGKAPRASRSHSVLEASIHYLMSDVVESSKIALQPVTNHSTVSKPTSAKGSSGSEQKIASGAESKSATDSKDGGVPADLPLGDFYQACFSLSCLSELLASYSACKGVFLSYSTRRPIKEVAAVPSKASKSSFLYFLLNDLIPVGSLLHPSDFESKRRAALSNWASLTIVALCYDTNGPFANKESAAAELVSIRKTVLDAISKAFKEATASSEPTDVRNGRLFALSDLCYRLLTSRPYPSVNKPNDEASMQLAKLMLERNFAVILTNALADVDLNFPSVSSLINSILRPLEQLTKVVTKVGRAKNSTQASRREEDEASTDESSMDEGEEIDVDTEEEEAPDLYRNSALGMYEGELEPGHQEDIYIEGSEDEYDEDDELMEEMEDGMIPGSDVSDVSEDEDAVFADEMDGMASDEDDEDDEDDDDEDEDDESDSSGDEIEVEVDMEGEDGDIVDLDRVEVDDEEAPWANEDEEDEGIEADAEGNDSGLIDFDGPEGLHAEDGGDSDDGEAFTDIEEMFLTGDLVQGELEFDADMTEQMNAQQGGSSGFGWDTLVAGEGNRRPHLHSDDMMLVGGPTIYDRPGYQTRTAASHPLLVDAPAPDPRQDIPARRQRGGTARGTPEYNAWVESIEQMIGSGAVEALQQLLGSHGLAHLTGPDQIRVQVAPGPDGGLAMVIDPTPAIQAAHAQATATRNGAHLRANASQGPPRSVARQLTDRLNATSEFLPVTTVQRWQEEGRLMQWSILLSERVARAVNHVINILHDPARKLAREIKADLKAKELENASTSTNEIENPADISTTTTSQPSASVESVPAQVEPALRQVPAAIPNLPDNAVAATNSIEGGGERMEGVTTQDGIAEVLSLARSLAASMTVPSTGTPLSATVVSETMPIASDLEINVSEPSATPLGVPAVELQSAVEGGEHHEDTHAEANPVESIASSQARQTILIHGNEVDISDTGIDPEFLEALPDDMREEVLNQHFRESRSSRPPPAAPTSINSEFLDALPPDLRAEVLRQEAAEQRREQEAARRLAESTASSAETGRQAATGPVDMDPASFFATLDPQLRQAVLMEQEDGYLSTLPAQLIEEANAFREQAGRRGQTQGALQTLSTLRIADSSINANVKKPTVQREAIQLLDKSGLATLVRLLFFPQPLRRNALQKVLVNLCENSRTRMDLINLLLTILQDGTRDVSAVDKSFSRMSLRASKSLTTAKDTPRKKHPETPGGALPHFPGESVPNLIAQRCLEALIYLVSSNTQSPLFFLTEQEVHLAHHRRSAKKGKGKEKAVALKTFPIIILLGLLDRPTLLKTQSMMDSLTQLLSAITKPLSIIPKNVKTTGEIVKSSTPTIRSTSEDQPMVVNPSGNGFSVTDDVAGQKPEKDEARATKDSSPSDDLAKNPPRIPAAVLCLVVNILDAGECSSKTFQQTLILIQNLSYLPEARDIISAELKSRAQALCDQLVVDLDELSSSIQKDERSRGVTLAKFSPASSRQAKLLRILKTIDWTHSSAKRSNSNAAPEDLPGLSDLKKITEEELRVSEIYDSFSFENLWLHLGDCLSAVEKQPELLFIATVLLPLIESLMVVSKYVASRRGMEEASIKESKEAMSPRSVDHSDPMENLFLSFTSNHKKTLNTMVRNNPALMSGSFSILVHNPKVLEFDNKRSYFFSRVHDRAQRQRSHYPTLQVNVRRQQVFEDSFHKLHGRSGDEIKYGKLSVKFHEEEGVDAGGVTREWFSVLARQMFNPGYALFQPQAADALTYQPNKMSAVNEHHLSYFTFVGRIIGKAIHDQRILEAHFSRSVYKHMLGKPVDHSDLESIDPEYHKSLVWMLENDIEGVIDLTFSIERDEFGVAEVIDLIPKGREVVVTNENKAEYVRLIAEQRLSKDIKEQIDALLRGLYQIVPKDLLQIFSEKELELLISGLPEIDVDEWRANTDLHNFTSTDPVIGYFWRAVRSFTLEERAKLLQFVSGSSRVPLEGFGALQGMSGVTKFSITSAGATPKLPTAHTCFNQLDLPNNYASYEDLRKALLTAITEGAGGFGFA